MRPTNEFFEMACFDHSLLSWQPTRFLSPLLNHAVYGFVHAFLQFRRDDKSIRRRFCNIALNITKRRALQRPIRNIGEHDLGDISC